MTETRGSVAPHTRVVAALVPLALLGFALYSFGSLVVETKGFPLDDSWIHQVVGRNLAEHGVPFFSLHGQSSGSTSAVWPFFVALNYLAFPGVPPAVFLLALNFLCLTAIVAIVFYAAVEDGLCGVEVSAASAGAIISGNFVWLAITGMEHIAFVAFILAGTALLLFRPDPNARWRTLAGGTFLGLSIMTRIEAVSLIPVFCVILFLQKREREAWIHLFAPVALGLALTLAYNFWTSGAPLPTTFSGRKWLFFKSVHVPLRAHVYFVTSYLPAFIRSEYPDAGYAIYLGIALSMPFGIFTAYRERRWRLLLIAFLSLYLFAVYAVLMPSFGHGMRYVALPLLSSSIFAAYGFVALGRSIGARVSHARAFMGHGALAGCAVIGVLSLQTWTAISRAGIEHIAGTQVRMGQWLAQRLPRGTTIASFDIGAIAWFSRLHVIDLGGLTDPAFTPYLMSGRSAEYLALRGVRWLAIPADRITFVRTSPCDDIFEKQLALCESSRLRKTPVLLVSTPFQTWQLGYQWTGHAMPGQKLFRLDWKP